MSVARAGVYGRQPWRSILGVVVGFADGLGGGHAPGVGLATLFDFLHQALQAFCRLGGGSEGRGVAQQDVVVATDVFDQDDRLAAACLADLELLRDFGLR
ncbi:hypothetical protein SDC9_104146 [bioreactor metagenome]|uniref:Uncharacterized protein n=1 Tax=bioreactor metagenome TaxID=1076179 RepID=A0A645B6H6_9ZZZZ